MDAQPLHLRSSREVVYGSNEAVTIGVARLLVEKGWENVHALTGGREAQRLASVLRRCFKATRRSLRAPCPPDLVRAVDARDTACSDAEDPPSGGRSAACLAVSPELGSTGSTPSTAAPFWLNDTRRLRASTAAPFDPCDIFAMRPATARGGRGQSPQRDPELMSRVKERDPKRARARKARARKARARKRRARGVGDSSEERGWTVRGPAIETHGWRRRVHRAGRPRALPRLQELREAKKKLSRELQAAQRSLTKSEQEVNKLTGQLARTEQQAQQATVKKNREGEKHEEGIGRIRQKHGKAGTVGGVLREKMANVGQARGRLAHVQFALSMLEKGVIIQVGEADQQPVEHTGPPQPVRRRRRSVGTGEAGEGGEEEYYEEGEALEGEEGETQNPIETRFRDRWPNSFACTDRRRGIFHSVPVRGDASAKRHEENRRLREHLQDSDQRCYTAVQLLQQAQDVLEQRTSDGVDSEYKMKVSIEKEKPLEMTMETASTMHSSREECESAQPSPVSPNERPATQPALHVQPPNLAEPPNLPSLLGGAPPSEKRIFYAGSTLGPNRMVSCPMPPPFGYQPMQLPQASENTSQRAVGKNPRA
eukprot:g7495.t1